MNRVVVFLLASLAQVYEYTVEQCATAGSVTHEKGRENDRIAGRQIYSVMGGGRGTNRRIRYRKTLEGGERNPSSHRVIFCRPFFPTCAWCQKTSVQLQAVAQCR